MILSNNIKLHSELEDLTGLLLVGVGVDFCTPVTRKTTNNPNNNPQLAFTRRKGHTCMTFDV